MVSTALVTASLTAAASAAPFDSDRNASVDRPMPAGDHLIDGRVTLPPRAFVTFCETYVNQCSRQGEADEMRLDAAAWQTLRDVNREVNHRIVSRSDAPGTDVWQLNVSAGDCDEYALEKRRELLERGWSSSALSLAAAYIPSGEAHLVLTVRTSRGDFVLDNLRDSVSPADSTGYRWIARQSSLHPRLWVRVLNTNVPVAAARLSMPPLRPSIDPARDIATDSERDSASNINRDIGHPAVASRREIGRGIGTSAPRRSERLSSRDIGFGIGD